MRPSVPVVPGFEICSLLEPSQNQPLATRAFPNVSEPGQKVPSWDGDFEDKMLITPEGFQV